MILDTLDGLSVYTGMLPLLEEARRFLASCSRDTPVGRYPLDGDRLYALVKEGSTAPVQSGCWESHRDYLDLHAVLEGEEVIGWTPAPVLAVTRPYLPEKDCTLYQGRAAEQFVLRPGLAALFFPQDAHRVNGCMDEPAHLKKVVIKLRLL